MIKVKVRTTRGGRHIATLGIPPDVPAAELTAAVTHWAKANAVGKVQSFKVIGPADA